MYDALDCLYEEQENPSETFIQFLSDANPYIWENRCTADPAVQADFDKSMNKQNIDEEVDEETDYYAIKNFLNEEYRKYFEWFGDENKTAPTFAELFSDISLDDWKKFCEIIVDE